MFRKVIHTEILPLYGDEEHFQLWLNKEESWMEHYQSMKVTFSCKFDFGDYPFDSHDCGLDFGMPALVHNKSAKFGPIQILGRDSKTKLLDKEVEIPNDHLPYKFTIIGKEAYPHYSFKYFAPYSGVIINVKRETLGELVGGFYSPTAIFALLSMLFQFGPEDRSLCI